IDGSHGPGRRKGVPNKATAVVRELARRLVQDPKYLASLQRRLRHGEAGSMEPMLWNHAYGHRDTRDLRSATASPCTGLFGLDGLAPKSRDYRPCFGCFGSSRRRNAGKIGLMSTGSSQQGLYGRAAPRPGGGALRE